MSDSVLEMSPLTRGEREATSGFQTEIKLAVEISDLWPADVRTGDAPEVQSGAGEFSCVLKACAEGESDEA